MQLKWGDYPFPVNSAACTTRTSYVRNKGGRPVRKIIRFDVKARLFGGTQEELTQAEDNCRTALEKPYSDLILRRNDGGLSGLRLIEKEAVSGVVIVDGPNFTQAMSPDYVTIRTVEFTAEAEIIIKGAENQLIDWWETLDIQGNGGPVRKWRIPINADPIQQEITPGSIIRYTQSGMAVGHKGRPNPAEPLFPRKYMLNDQESVKRGFPEAKKDKFLNWPVYWTYVFESPRPLTGELKLPKF